MALIVIAIVVLLLFNFTRMLIFNLHNVIIYSVKDLYNYFKYKKWQDFNYYGIDMFIAMFGKGKTLSMTHKAMQIYKRFGDKVRFISNYHLSGIPYIPLINFNQLVGLGAYEDDPYVGTVVLVDEISSVLSHRNFASFPLELLSMLCQQRKRKIYIMCTAQRFFMVDKIWRGITTHVINCNKIWRLQHNTYYDAWDYENATSAQIIQRLSHNWWFVKDQDYGAYDTSEMISRSKAADFISNEESIVRKGLDAGVQANEAGVGKLNRKGKKRLKK